MSVQPKAAPPRRPREHFAPELTLAEWAQGYEWRQVGSGIEWERSKLGFFARCCRLLFGNPPQPPKQDSKPAPLKPYTYPPDLDLDAFFFRLDIGGNPRDPGFVWAWEKPLRDLEDVEIENGRRSTKQRRSDDQFERFMQSAHVDFEAFKLAEQGLQHEWVGGRKPSRVIETQHHVSGDGIRTVEHVLPEQLQRPIRRSIPSRK